MIIKVINETTFVVESRITGITTKFMTTRSQMNLSHCWQSAFVWFSLFTAGLISLCILDADGCAHITIQPYSHIPLWPEDVSSTMMSGNTSQLPLSPGSQLRFIVQWLSGIHMLSPGKMTSCLVVLIETHGWDTTGAGNDDARVVNRPSVGGRHRWATGSWLKESGCGPSLVMIANGVFLRAEGDSNWPPKITLGYIPLINLWFSLPPNHHLQWMTLPFMLRDDVWASVDIFTSSSCCLFQNAHLFLPQHNFCC